MLYVTSHTNILYIPRSAASEETTLLMQLQSEQGGDVTTLQLTDTGNSKLYYVCSLCGEFDEVFSGEYKYSILDGNGEQIAGGLIVIGDTGEFTKEDTDVTSFNIREYGE